MSHIFGNIGVTAITDVIDANKSLGINLSGATAETSLTLDLSQTTNRNWTVPDASSTFTGTDLIQTITNKTVYEPTSISLSAAGGTQGTATALTSMYNVVTTVPVSSGVILPTPSFTGLRIVVNNKGANDLAIYPGVGATIDNGATNASISLLPDASITFESTSTTSWLTVVPPVVAASGMAVAYVDGRTTVASNLTPANLPANIVTDTLVSDQNDYDPTGLTTAVQLRLDASGADRTITGLQSYGTAGSPVLSDLKITNIGTTFSIILSHLSGSSLAANQFAFDTNDIVLLPGQSVTLYYDFTSSKWRGVSMSQDGNMGGIFSTPGVITPPALSTDQDDYNPTGLSNASIIRLSATALISITGLAGGKNGRRIQFVNIGSNPITLATESLSSLAANRFNTGSTNATLVGSATVSFTYDGTSSLWRITSGTGGVTTGAGGLVQSQWTEVKIDRTTTNRTWSNAYAIISVAGTLPQATITVQTTGAIAPTNNSLGSPGFPTSGMISVLTTLNDIQVVSYTGTTGTTFTGCTGGTGAFGVGAYIWGGPEQTTIAAGSNGVALPTATINVASTVGFPTSGDIIVDTDCGGKPVSYTGTTATTFTGCTGGGGIMSTGGIVTNVTADPTDLLSLPITTNGGALIINSAASASTESNKTGYFQIIMDGFFLRGGSTQGNGGAPAGSAVIGLKLSNVPTGYHYVVLRWLVSGGVLGILPVTQSIHNNANLLIQEVSS